MLSVGPTSSCDICYEPFGQDSNAPWSIECGHVFCGECIHNGSFDPLLCPLCRSPFKPASCVKLHVDVISPELSAVEVAGAKEARRLQYSIASIPEKGATEPSLRQLIQEGNDFLAKQPRNSFKELRNAHTIIAYLYDVKIKHKAQKQALETIKEQTNQLTKEKDRLAKEKAELLQKYERLTEERQYERDTSAAVENTLREHCAQARQSQKATAEQLKKVEQENADLKRQLRVVSERWPVKSYTPPEPVEVVSRADYFELPLQLDKLDMNDVAIQDPNISFLISPQTVRNALPFASEHSSPLSNLMEDDEESQVDTDDSEEVVTPDGPHQPQQMRHAETRGVRPPVLSDPVPPCPAPKPPLEPSGISRTAPYRVHRGRERSSSSPTRPTSRSHSPFDNITRSHSPTPPTSTKASQNGTASREPYHSKDRFGLQSRLHDILSDAHGPSSAPTSSSFPSSLIRDGGNMYKDDRGHAGSSRSEPYGSAAPQPVSGGGSHPSSSTAHLSSNKTPLSTSPNHLVGTRMSSASAEAKKLEEERRRKHREEKYGPDYDKLHNDFERDVRQWYIPPSNHSNGPTLATSSASQAARREQHQPYGNPLNANSTSSLKRSATTNGASYGRSAATQLPMSHTQDQGTVSSSRPPYGSSNKSFQNSALQSNHASTLYT